MLSERQREAMDPSRSMCVTAGAGAGKTHTLVEKYIHLIKSGVAVPEILALTFTEKAAAEMKHRVRTSIMKLQGEGVGPGQGGDQLVQDLHVPRVLR